MTTIHAHPAWISLIALCAMYTLPTVLHAQPASNDCGILTWSLADQKHSTLPCASPAQKAADGKEMCGITAWSQEEQRQTVLPCASPTAANGTESCSMLTWSPADQRHVMTPCETSYQGGLTPPVHYGE